MSARNSMGITPRVRGGTQIGALTGTLATVNYPFFQSLIITGDAFTVGVAGSPADIGTITIPASLGITRYKVIVGSSSNGGGMNLYAKTAAGTLVAATFDLRTAAAGGGTSLLTGGPVAGPTAVSTIAVIAASTALFTAMTLYLRQVTDSLNAGTVVPSITIFPIG